MGQVTREKKKVCLSVAMSVHVSSTASEAERKQLDSEQQSTFKS